MSYSSLQSDILDDYTGGYAESDYDEFVSNRVDNAIPVMSYDIIRAWESLSRTDPEYYDGDGGIIDRMVWVIVEEWREDIESDMQMIQDDAALHLSGQIAELPRTGWDADTQSECGDIVEGLEAVLRAEYFPQQQHEFLVDAAEFIRRYR